MLFLDHTRDRERERERGRERERQNQQRIAEVTMSAPRSVHPENEGRFPRRNLRPRQERSYAESPDVVLLSDDEPRINGFANGYDGDDSDEGELPPIPSPPIKVFLKK